MLVNFSLYAIEIDLEALLFKQAYQPDAAVNKP